AAVRPDLRPGGLLPRLRERPRGRRIVLPHPHVRAAGADPGAGGLAAGLRGGGAGAVVAGGGAAGAAAVRPAGAAAVAGVPAGGPAGLVPGAAVAAVRAALAARDRGHGGADPRRGRGPRRPS